MKSRRSAVVCPYSKKLQSSKMRSEVHTSELQSRGHLVCRLLLEKKNRRVTAQARVRADPLAELEPARPGRTRSRVEAGGAEPADLPLPPGAARAAAARRCMDVAR